MKIAIIILAAVLLIILLLFLIPVKVNFLFEKDEELNKKNIIIKYGFVKIEPLKEKKHKKKGGGKAEKSDFETKLQNIKRYIGILEKTKDDFAYILNYAKNKTISFDNIEFVSDFGFENAMNTGIFTGLYNGLVYNILGLIHNNMILRKMKVEINPKFDKPMFNIHFLCILHLKTAQTIIIGFYVLKLLKKCKKEGSK